MSDGKEKSSGWRPAGERRSWQAQKARIVGAQRAEKRHECDGLGLWRACPDRQCRRARGCTGDPRQYLERATAKASPANSPQSPAGDGRRLKAVIGNGPPLPAMSAKEAAAAIAASIANFTPPAFDE